MGPVAQWIIGLAMAVVVAAAGIYLLVAGDSRTLGWSLLGVAVLIVLGAAFDGRDRHIRR
jgi:hypothetical protein